ncbi:unnamed protein product [Ectocarpus fasciculatus]
MPPIKTHNFIEKHSWSRRLESAGKDIECCFGRVKGRWRLFRGSIHFGSREKIDNAWFTACNLHMLHKFNGLDKMEEDADWVGSAGELGDMPQQPVGMGEDKEEGEIETVAPGFQGFRAKLVTHFAYMWRMKQMFLFMRAEV